MKGTFSCEELFKLVEDMCDAFYEWGYDGGNSEYRQKALESEAKLKEAIKRDKVKKPELFDEDYLVEKLKFIHTSCIESCDEHCPYYGKLNTSDDDDESLCIADITMELWRRWENQKKRIIKLEDKLSESNN